MLISASSKSEYMCDLIRKKGSRRSPCTAISAQEAHAHDDTKLLPREEEHQRNLREDHLLEHHCKANDGSNHDAQETTCHDQDKCFIDIKHLNLALGVAHRPEHS